MNITEKVAYLKGLLNGLSIDTETKEGKLFTAIIDVLDEMALWIVDVEEAYDELQEVVDAIDEDLGEVEEDLYGDECDDDDCDCDCEEEYEVVCPECGDSIYLNYDMLEEGEMTCPNCGEHLEFDLDAMDDDCHCEGGHCDCGCED